MLFPYHFDSPLTPSAVKIQRKNLKELERQHFSDYSVFELDRKSTRLNSSHITRSRMPSSA